MSGLNVIMIRDFYQAPPIQDLWISNQNKWINIIGMIFWCKNVKCYKLQEVMSQNDIKIVNILSKIWTTL